jgi:hypothetical protein
MTRIAFIIAFVITTCSVVSAQAPDYLEKLAPQIKAAIIARKDFDAKALLSGT